MEEKQLNELVNAIDNITIRLERMTDSIETIAEVIYEKRADEQYKERRGKLGDLFMKCTDHKVNRKRKVGRPKNRKK